MAAVLRLSSTECAENTNARKRFGGLRAPLLLALVFWGCTFAVLSVRGVYYEPGRWTESVPPRAVVTIVGALLCAALAVALSGFRRLSFSALIATAVAAAILMSIAQAWLQMKVYDLWYSEPVGPTGQAGLVLWSIFWLGYFLAWTGTYLALVYHEDVLGQEQRLAAMREFAQEAKIAALHYQINPHFLFNTINSISAFVLESQPQEAERVLINLADFLRRTMAMDAGKTVTLAEEIALQELYLEIEKVRFSERIGVRIDIPDGLRDIYLPPLILQPLVENAVKHGVGRSETRTLISIKARRHEQLLLLSVCDDARGGQSPRGTGMGLRNVRERLRAHYGDSAQLTVGPLTPGGYCAALELPIADAANSVAPQRLRPNREAF
jgi:two-component sensor histidine kinase